MHCLYAKIKDKVGHSKVFDSHSNISDQILESCSRGPLGHFNVNFQIPPRKFHFKRKTDRSFIRKKVFMAPFRCTKMLQINLSNFTGEGKIKKSLKIAKMMKIWLFCEIFKTSIANKVTEIDL